MKKFIAVVCMILALSTLCSCDSLFAMVAESNKQPNVTVRVSSDESEDGENESLLYLKPEEIRPKIWKVEAEDGDSGTLYLFGSIHIGVEELYPLDERIEDAYNDSDAVAVEVDVISMEYGVNNLDGQYQEYLMYNDGTSMVQHLSAEAYAMAYTYLQENHISIYPYLAYKPYVLSELIASVKQENSDEIMPYSSEFGIDRHYLTRAKLDGKQVLEVEDASTRMKLYGDYSDDVQEYLLLSSLYSEVDYDSSMDMLREWAQGDLDSIAESNDYENSEEFKKLDKASQKIYEEYNKAMMTDRNKIMLDKAEEYLEKDMTVMYIVGCAHMVGEDGLVNQLEKNGWKVTELD